MTLHRDEEQVPKAAKLRIRFPIQGGEATLSGEQKWRRAIELGDLAPDTVVEALRGSEQTTGPASRVAELIPLFIQCGFVVEAEPETEPETEPVPSAPVQERSGPGPADAKLWFEQDRFNVERPVAAAKAVSGGVTAETPPVKRDSWEAIGKVADPGPDPDLPQRFEWVGPEDQLKRALPRDIRRGGSLFLCGVALLLFIGDANPLWPILLMAIAFAIWPWPPIEAGLAARQSVRERRNAWNILLKEWRAKATRARYDAIMAQLRTAKQGLDALDRRRINMLTALDSRDNQLNEHLAGFVIEAGHIPGIGPSQVRVLKQIGYRTAADLSTILNVIAPLGERDTRALMGWRAGCAATFTYNPARSKEPERIRKIDNELRPERLRLEGPFEGAVRRLNVARAEIIAARAELQPRLRAAWFSLCEAKLARRAL